MFLNLCCPLWTSSVTGGSVTLAWLLLNQKHLETWWRAWTSISSTLRIVSLMLENRTRKKINMLQQPFILLHCECINVYDVSVQCWVRTVSLCIQLFWTLTCTWSERMPPASPISDWRSTWTVRGAHAAANQRRPACGTAEMPSGSISTSTALERLPHRYSEAHRAEVHIHCYWRTLELLNRSNCSLGVQC